MAKNARNAKERIIESAQHLFSEKGYHAVGVREITAHAKTNISLVSFYFNGKSGLLKHLFATLVDSGMQEIDRILIAPASAQEFKNRLELFLETLAKFYVQHSELLRIYLQELENGNVEAVTRNGETFGGVWEKLIRFLEHAKEKNYISMTDTRVLAVQIMSPLNNLMQNKNCSVRLTNLSLSDDVFRRLLIKQIVATTSVSPP